MMADVVVGIDLGTTNSCVACYMNGQVKILENSEEGRTTPSVLFFTEKNATIVGEFAKKLSFTAKPEYGVLEIKRLVGRKLDDTYVQNNLRYFPFKLDNSSNDPVVLIDHPGQTLRKKPVELCAAILTKMKKDAEHRLGHTVEKAVITVPAYFNISQREATLAAGNQAGFTVLKLLNEPTAAALSYYLENDSSENYSLVYDLGGGTFDVAILKRNSKNIDIICVDGDTHLGGQDFDNLIKEYVCTELQKRYNYNPRSDRRTMRRLHNFCEEAKKTLSVLEETVIHLHGLVKNQNTVEIPLARAQFEAMAEAHFKKTIDIVDTCLKSSNLDKSVIKEVILSGGSTRIPKIQQMLSDYFGGKNLNKFVNPDECVAEGAALQAAMLSTNSNQKITQMRVSDVTPLSLGLSNFVNVMNVLIERNTPIPASKDSTRITVYDEQRSMTFHIYEGERKNAVKNHCLGSMTIKDITPAPPGQCEVTFKMTLDLNGILTVTAKEKYKNNVKDLKVTYTRGHRSDSEVKNAVKDAEDHREEDKKFVEFAAHKEYLLNYCIRAIYNFESKNLTQEYKEVYRLCQSFKTKAEKSEVKDEANVKKMIQEIKQRCHTVVDEYHFEFMPTFRSF